jgi:hypothetical protein
MTAMFPAMKIFRALPSNTKQMSAHAIFWFTQLALQTKAISKDSF